MYKELDVTHEKNLLSHHSIQNKIIVKTKVTEKFNQLS